MSQQDLLTEVTLALKQQGIEFLLTGSHASSLQGEARSTHDIDLLVRLTLDDVDSLSRIFPPDRFYLSKSAMQEAIRAGRMFNVLETTTGEKIDFWVLTDTAFDQSRFARRQKIQLPGLSLDVSSPEDTILMKLWWGRRSGGSEKQFQDVLRVYELQGEVLDQEYLQKWASELGVVELWQRVLREAEPLLPPGSIPSGS
jgi:hypothetical protein